MTTTTSTLDTFKRITSTIMKYTRGGACESIHEEWSWFTGHKDMKFAWEKKELERLAKKEEVEYTKLSNGFMVVLYDKANDTEYMVSFERAAYIGKADTLRASVCYGKSIADAE